MAEQMRIAIIVNPELPVGLIANTTSAVGIGLAARFPQLAGAVLSDSEGKEIDVSSKLPVPILQANASQMREVLLKALVATHERAIVPFPAFARSMHSFEDYEATFPLRSLTNEQLDGLGLVGPEKWVRSLTGALKLLR
ncbi:Uncharacterized protein conserved in bacteria [Yersinia bercovieri]|uniref:DUF2000 domain-containing protein n=3 Tax=Yersinia bercovieri TaxID=634 RepID=A0A2G4U3N0_YERBE|nr:DUF2000 domain-containing protein [Yersinia bercovieri]EEQ07375.1 hypothetical protein yberc0001_31880 [Yersinia bercovieri ATCC 43970]PHZ27923.1 DUF2000 domain-containing protein [Yersinia bercovieri]CNF04692.1 Uncharacterized protein conserved in bacteria [Yersinia bercovieri]